MRTGTLRSLKKAENSHFGDLEYKVSYVTGMVHKFCSDKLSLPTYLRDFLEHFSVVWAEVHHHQIAIFSLEFIHISIVIEVWDKRI